MIWALVASLILPWLLVYLGLHIVQRGVIFVDLALAQTAAFGTCVAIIVGYDVHDWHSYAFSLGFTLVGAVVLTFTRSRRPQVPQEALIGVVYVVSAAAAILALSKSAGGGSEELKWSLVGELEVLKSSEVIKTFALFAVIGVVHFVFRKKFLAISADPERAAASGLNVRWWDFVFYLLFGLVVMSFVHIGGVLLVFSYLVVPAVCANYLANSFAARFAVGWAITTFASLASILITTNADLPAGAGIVCMLGIMLVFAAMGAKLKRNLARKAHS
jgi:zinc/manganese transport system permease protein